MNRPPSIRNIDGETEAKADATCGCDCECTSNGECGYVDVKKCTSESNRDASRDDNRA